MKEGFGKKAMSSEIKKGIFRPLPNDRLETLERIANCWVTPEGNWYRAEIPHNSFAADPYSTCTGIISVKFRWRESGIKELPCQGCKATVEVSLAPLQIGLRIW